MEGNRNRKDNKGREKARRDRRKRDNQYRGILRQEGQETQEEKAPRNKSNGKKDKK